MSDTPRTDQQAREWDDGFAMPSDLIALARELERENAALLNQLHQAAADEGKLRRENTRLLEAILNAPKARKEAQP